MGQEVDAVCHWQGNVAEGRVWLEHDHIRFRSTFRFKLMLNQLKEISAANGLLTLITEEGTAVLELGARAESWAQRILHPKTAPDKMGIKPGTAIDLYGGALDLELESALRQADCLIQIGNADERRNTTQILTATQLQDLALLDRLAPRLDKGDNLWILYLKGGSIADAPNGTSVMAAGRAAGLVDTKVCAVSAQTTGLKFVRSKGR